MHTNFPLAFKLFKITAFSICLVSRCAFGQGVGQAVIGEPFGVASLRIPVAPRDPADPASWKAIEVTERQGRVHYPAIRTGVLPGAGREADGLPPGSVTLSFLFVGSEPLELTIAAPEPIRVTLTPTRQPRRFRRQVTRWWRDYNAAIRQDARLDDYPGIANVYLASMLSNRLGLEPPLLSRNPRDAGSELQQTLELLRGAEGLREHLVRQMMRPQPSAINSRPVPKDVEWLPVAGQSAFEDAPITIEPIAGHVPAECFYIRFGQFSNYLWLNQLLRDYGGDIGRMASLRGQDPQLNQRLQDRLALRQGKLAEIFGGQVIADVAIIGRDLYMAEGAAMGVLFQARNSLALSTDLRQQRKTAQLAAEEEGALLEIIEIDGRKVSLLSTPSGRLRSFYAVHGDFHLVSTSEAIVRRFFEAGEGLAPLADSHHFQLARQGMSVDRDDTIFAYFSPEFFQALISPQYQIGLRRRLQADTAIVLVQLAELAATAEGLADISLDGLISARFLPQGFGRIADGSGPILATNEVIDSLRGARGSFTPIADIRLQGISAEEATWYAEVAAYFQQNWRQMDPLIVGIRREPGDTADAERVIVDANVSPIAEEKYGWILSSLGPPTTHELKPTSNDIISMQAMVKGGSLSDGVPPHHLFLGIKDSDIPVSPWPSGLLKTIQLLQTAPSYLGAWPKLGFLDWLPFGLAGQPDLAGFSKLPLGAVRWQGDGFSVVSFQQSVLEQTVPELEFVPTDNAAQIRVRIGDLSRSNLSNWINVQNYERAFLASAGNVRFMRLLSSQFKVPGADAREIAERIFNSQLVCALGGEYEFDDRDGQLGWRSTAWPNGERSLPADYAAPLMGWFRGANLEITKAADRLVMRAEIEMHRESTQPKSGLPFLDFFKGKKEDARAE